MPRLQPGDWSGYRKPEEVAAIKQAVAQGLPFRQFWIEMASKWPQYAHLPDLSGGKRGGCGTRTHLPKNPPDYISLRNLYSYYSYRYRGHANYVNATTPEPHGYTVAQRLLAYSSIAAGDRFSTFWRTIGHTWKIPMYRLGNWFRGLVKNWRDVVAASPNMSEEDKLLAVQACATRMSGDGSKGVMLVMLTIGAAPLGRRKYVANYLRMHLGLSRDEAAAMARQGADIVPMQTARALRLQTDLQNLGVVAEVKL